MSYKKDPEFRSFYFVDNSIEISNKCCLMTCGCLLRPHREIRELSWSNFSDDLKYIHLSRIRNKSVRNRIVPVPSYIRDILKKRESDHNIFSNKPQPYNDEYFKTLWSRFKAQSTLLEQVHCTHLGTQEQ